MVTPQNIVKRDGTPQPFDLGKIRASLEKAWMEVKGSVDERNLAKVTSAVETALGGVAGDVPVEVIQDLIEVELMRSRRFDVAKAYILYRQKRQDLRVLRTPKVPDSRAIADYIHAGKYAKYLPERKRREVYSETVARAEAMHIRKFPSLEAEIRDAFNAVRAKRVLPSMRSLQFGGAAMEAVNNRNYNCSFSLIDRMEAFSEAFYLLLCGCGVGYSIQQDHVDKLDTLRYVDPKAVKHHVIEDTIEGWADALKALVYSYVDGVNLEFAYHKIRPAGSPLKTSGGKAPGHLSLKLALERVRGVLSQAQGRKLRPVECHRILCHAADAVLSGGVRRSSMLALFSLEDSEMMHVKTGNWYSSEPWLANANNSVALKRDEVKKKQFKRIFKMTREWGEPGFYFLNDYSYGCNPCAEIGLNPVLVIDEVARQLCAKKGIQVSLGEVFTGFAFCNLCEINAAKLTSLEDFEKAAKAATLIGTLQATYTHMPYLGWVSEVLAEREALLGIGMTGMMDAPSIALNPEYQRTVATKIKAWNAEYAAILGIRPAARTTTVKPSGTTSLELECVASGIHPHHDKRYIRRVTANELEPVFQKFREINPHMVVRKPNGDYVIEFMVAAPEGATVKRDLTAIQFLDIVKSTQENWVVPGTAYDTYAPGLNHNVSNTVVVRAHEWEQVADYLWENRNSFTGVSFIPDTGDKNYAFAPLEGIQTEGDEARWNSVIEGYRPVDYEKLIEEEDTTSLAGEVACGAGGCEVK